MKNFLFVCGMLLMVIMTYAQGTKQVAILEVVDKEGKLTYSQKLVLRSNMARAVANTPGYEAYDRSDVDAIMSEHEFQRTGLVSDAEIRKLGEMTGVSLILVTEAVVLGGDKLFVSAKILNVETAHVEMMDNVNMDVSNMQEGCNSLASRLFGTNAVSSASSRYRISRLRDGCYAYQNMTLDEKAYMHFLQNNCPEAYAQHKKGKLMADGGWAAFAAGLAMTGVGAALICVANNNAQSYTQQINDVQAQIDKLDNEMESKYGHQSSKYSGWRNWYDFLCRDHSEYNAITEMRQAIDAIDAYNAQIKGIKQQRDSDPAVGPYKSSGTALAVVGPIVTAGSVPLLYFGYKTKKKSVEVYNANCVSSSVQTISLNITSGQNGLGLALQF